MQNSRHISALGIRNGQFLSQTRKLKSKTFGRERTSVRETASPQTHSCTMPKSWKILTQMKTRILGFSFTNPWASWFQSRTPNLELLASELQRVQLDNCPMLRCTCKHPPIDQLQRVGFQESEAVPSLGFCAPVFSFPAPRAQPNPAGPIGGKACLGSTVDVLWGRFGVVLGGGGFLVSFWGRFQVKGRCGVDLCQAISSTTWSRPCHWTEPLGREWPLHDGGIFFNASHHHGGGVGTTQRSDNEEKTNSTTETTPQVVSFHMAAEPTT